MSTDPRLTPLVFPPGLFKARSKTTRCVIHSLDTPPSWKFDIREIDRWHREERGWSAIGYHIVIDRLGNAIVGRPMDVIGAHQIGWNSTSIAIALAGGKGAKKDDPFDKHYTDPQSLVLHNLVNSIVRLWPGIIVCGHHDHPKVTKTCPGFNATAWWAPYA